MSYRPSYSGHQKSMSKQMQILKIDLPNMFEFFFPKIFKLKERADRTLTGFDGCCLIAFHGPTEL